MPLEAREAGLLLDIVLAARDAESFVKGLDWAQFLASRLHQNAVIRSLEIIGEAAGKLSARFTESRPDLPWREIINMRHRLIHAYNDVRLDVVWATVETDVPLILRVVEPLLKDIE
jgi:uncharacterized protein with HEPN domain